MQDKDIHIIEQKNGTIWFKGSPIALCSVTFFKRPDDGKLYVTALFQNEQANEISEASIKILCYDTSRKLLPQTVTYTYGYLSCTRNGCFGDGCDIEIINTHTRFVEILLVSVTDINGNKWENTKQKKFDISLFQQNIYTSLDNLYPAFHDVCKENHINPEPLMFEPKFTLDYWLCACGCLNWNNEKCCAFCQTDKSFLIENLQVDGLEERLPNSDEVKKHKDHPLLKHNEEQNPEEIRQRNLRLTRQRSKWLRKQFLKIAIILVVVTALIFCGYVAYNSIIKPYMDYVEAQSMLSSGQYDEAALAFTKLGEYSNSPEKVLEAKYKKAVELYNNGNINSAIQIFSSLGNYLDAQERYKKIQYELAQKYQNEGNYEKALSLYNILGNYEEAAQNADVCCKSIYNTAEQMYKKKQYKEAYNLFSTISEYSDSNEKATKSQFAQACDAYENLEYIIALDILETLTDYSPAQEMYKKLHTLQQILSSGIDNDTSSVWSASDLRCPMCNQNTLSYVLGFYPNGKYTFTMQCEYEAHKYTKTYEGLYRIENGLFFSLNENLEPNNELSLKIISIQHLGSDSEQPFVGKNSKIMIQNPFNPKQILQLYGNIIDENTVKIKFQK